MLPAIAILLIRFGASDFLLGLIKSSLPQAMAITMLPVVAYRSDRYRSRWGRRIPFIAFAAPFACVAMVGLAFSPILGGVLDRLLGTASPGANPCVIIWLSLFWMMFEFSSIICQSLFHGLIADVVPKAVIGRFYAMFRVVSTMAGMSYTYALQGRIQDFYFPIFIGIAVIFAVSFTCMCLKVKEGGYPPPPPPGEGVQPLAVVTYARECFSKPHYLWIYASVMLGYMATEPISTYIYAYAPSIGMDLGRLGKFQTVQLFVSLLMAYPLGWLVDRFHPLKVCLGALAMMALSTLAAYLLVHDGASLGIAVIWVGALSGAWSTSMLALAPTLFPKTRFSSFHSAMTLSYSVGLMVVVPVCGWMLDRTGHDYINIYYWGALMSTATFLATYAVYRRFVALGGAAGYQAP